jgi:hypothetical protein
MKLNARKISFEITAITVTIAIAKFNASPTSILVAFGIFVATSFAFALVRAARKAS